MASKTITCPVCKGTAVLKEKETELLEGLVVLKKDPYYYCQECREKFSTSTQVKKGLETLQKAFSFKRQVIKTGRSLAITIPTDLSEFYHLKKGSIVTLSPESGNKVEIVF